MHDADSADLALHIFAASTSINGTKNQNSETMIDKIVKNNKLMGIMAILTFAIVAYVLVYKPWKAKKDGQAA